MLVVSGPVSGQWAISVALRTVVPLKVSFDADGLSGIDETDE